MIYKIQFVEGSQKKTQTINVCGPYCAISYRPTKAGLRTILTALRVDVPITSGCPTESSVKGQRLIELIEEKG